ncbi:Fumarate hydratase class II [Desulfotomaculum nigrificans CO-1-SRB]|uniref:aspartate ammonia-lyase n=1 Tax=Desulfotomaculum nigrificans (strain DSM 14880 / VKM B-2319 / CO-1-SRB) TaxID=868595 RepID=F6B7P5_DESCC|nr:aspartate ammonia-lyase [Desulfotomaculum nigrificans]AEF93417.1 Fumarate hydratase class II [Desulfotomaculum nigrificans CO-1-SRB]
MFRIEQDLIGEVKIPKDAYYGIHTARAAENFKVSNNRVHPELIKALAVVKQAAADANMTVGLLDRKIGDAIYQAAGEIAEGKYLDQFIVDALQGGAGTSTNMNMNEVVANRAIELLGGEKGDYSLVHPINHVNMSQSTNDVYPTALRIAAMRMLQPLSESCAVLQGALQKKEAEFAGVLKVGRTEMQDAVPITLGQEFSAYAEAISRDRWRLYKVEERLRQINLGGTAVGTGLNAQRRYIYTVVERLRGLTGLGLSRAENMIDVTQNADVFVEVSGLIKANATTLAKIASDLRLLSSGPRAGLAEIKLPDLQAGSSIMPGKVNPVMPEMITQVAYQVIAHDMAITLAVQAGQLELNAFLPLIAANLLPAMEILSQAMRLFADRCILGISADKERCRELLHNSISIVTTLVPHIGYDEAAKIAKEALQRNTGVRQVILEKGIMTAEDLDAVLKPETAVKAGVLGR